MVGKYVFKIVAITTVPPFLFSVVISFICGFYDSDVELPKMRMPFGKRDLLL